MKTVLTFCLLGLALVTFGQNVIQVEYFLDVDAGFGKNTVRTVTPTADGPLSFTIDVSAASAGYHILYTRTRADNGAWSHTTMRNVEVFKNQGPGNVARVEYFFDTDPGVGKAAAIALATPLPDGTFTFVIPQNQTTPGPRTLYVRAQDSPNSNWSLTQGKAVTIVNCSPADQPAAVASQTVCAGSTVTFTVPAVASATGYQWAVPTGWTITGGQGTGTVTLRAPAVTSVTQFTALSVAAVNSCAAGTARLFAATVNALPSRPTVTASGDAELVSSATNGNQWFLNGMAINGATGRTHRPSAAGQYTVQTTEIGCVSPASEAYTFVVTAAEEPLANAIEVFPNPITDRITIVNKTHRPVRLQLYSLTGQPLMTKDGVTDTYQFNTGRLPVGCYVLSVADENRVVRKLILKK